MGEILYFKELSYGKFKEMSQNTLLQLAAGGYIKEDKDNNKSFDFVGIISADNNVTAFLPKIFKDEDIKDGKKCEDYLKLVIELLKLEQEKQTEFLLESNNDMELNITEEKSIGIIDFFFRDYEEYGLYENEEVHYIINGHGEINWELTIEEEDAVLSRGRPVYLNLHTRVNSVEENNYIMELHKYILEECIKRASNSPLQRVLNIFDIPNISFNIFEDRLGDREYQIHMIEREMRTQFSERKVRLLKAMKIFLCSLNIENYSDIVLWGTKQFWRVWENACGYIFGNEYKKGNLYYDQINEMTAGKWIEAEKISKPMKPDIVVNNGDILYIADAKYYNEENFCNNLGVQDIAKQFMYETALKEKIPENGKAVNIFLVPGSEEKYISRVSMGIFPYMNVHAVTLDGEKLFKSYLKREKRNIEELMGLIP